ncbi:MAG TPA: 16S rRNA (uracil(1498)-N(3))-methyltransferase [Syntrophomonadaceae bacterium]|nr:16S rRNA (uracil(1498)-N(3))-methyltransferase [Syntrophomonadaceae bacterium]
MRQFFVAPESIFSGQVILDKEQTKHIEKVLRLKMGEQIQVFDGQGRDYIVVLTARDNGCLIGKIISERTAAEPKIQLTLIQGIAKGDKMDTIIQKAVEIGCSRIIPTITRYTVVRLEKDRAVQKLERWQTIAREACKQCKRSIIPAIGPIVGFDELVGNLPGNSIILYENEEHIRLRTLLKQIQDSAPEKQEINLIVGPEGGFCEDEVQKARNHGVQVAGLGPYILRTETAGLVAASIVLYEYGEIG